MRQPSFLERVQSYDGYTPIERRAAGLPPIRPLPAAAIARERALRAQLQDETTIPEHVVLREATVAERKLIGAIRVALKEYDRTVKPDGRRNNGKRVDPKAVKRGVALVLSGVSIRDAAKRVGVSFGTLWKAKN